LGAAGVAGFLEKQTSAEILTQGIREVARGRRFFTPGVAGRLNGVRKRGGVAPVNDANLSTRECEVLQLVAEGFANKQVAAELRLSHQDR